MNHSPRVTILLTLACVILLARPGFCQQGYMKATVEKDWYINTSGNISEVSLDGFFLLNDSNQQVLSLDTSGVPNVSGQVVRVSADIRKPAQQETVRATAIIEISYSPFVPEDAQVPGSPIDMDSPTAYTPEIRAQAVALSRQSVLETVASFTYWIHNNITYNLSYFGTNIPASEVFIKRQGVCVEYSRLMISMLGAVGIKSRMVSGYILDGSEFQPHAWVEVFVGNGSVLADPTFGQAGALTAGHIPMGRSDDSSLPVGASPAAGANATPVANQSGSFDLLNAMGRGDFLLSQNVSLVPISFGNFKKSADLGYVYDNSSGTLNITVSNPSGSYAVLDYSFNSPKNSYGPDERIFALAPGSKATFTYTMDKSGKQAGYVYFVPFVAEIPGSSLNSTLEYEIPAQTNSSPIPSGQPCAPAFILAVLGASLAFYSRR